MAKSRKLSMKRRGTAKQRATTFSKRRQGLFNKAAEISMLCDARVVVLVSSLSSSKQKLYSYGYPSVDAMFDSFLGNRVLDDALDHDKTKNLALSLWEETMGLDHCTLQINKKNKSPEGFRMDLEELVKLNSIQELQAIVKTLENLRDKAVTKMRIQWPQSQGSSCSIVVVGNNENCKLDAAVEDNSDNWHLGHADNFCVLDRTGFLDHSPSSLIVNNFLVSKTEPAPGDTHYCNNINWLPSVTSIESVNSNGFRDVVGTRGSGQYFNTTDDLNSFFGTELMASSFDLDQDHTPFDPTFDDIDEAFLQAEIFMNNIEVDVASWDSNCDFNFLIEGVKMDSNVDSTSSGCSEAIDDHGYLSLPFYTSCSGDIEFEDLFLDGK